MLGQVSEGGQFEKTLPGRRRVNSFVLENPGEIMWDEDCVEAGGERGIDVRARRVADHPSRGGIAVVAHGERAVSVGVLFGQDLNGSEEFLEA